MLKLTKYHYAVLNEAAAHPRGVVSVVRATTKNRRRGVMLDEAAKALKDSGHLHLLGVEFSNTRAVAYREAAYEITAKGRKELDDRIRRRALIEELMAE